MKSVADAAHGIRAQNAMAKVSGVEHEAQGVLDALHVIGSPVAKFIAGSTLIHVELTNQVRQITGIDLHGA